jgi:hypothetical protein
MAPVYSKFRRAVLSYRRDYDPEEIPTVKLEREDDDGHRNKTQVSIINGSSIEAMLHSIREFKEIIDDLAIPPNERKTYFRKITKGTARDDWDVAATGTPNTNIGFKQALETFKLAYIPRDARNDQKDYIKNLTLHSNNTVRAHANRIKALCLLLIEFPGDVSIAITSDERKLIIFNGMPEPYITSWISADKKVESVTEVELLQYMDNQQKIHGNTNNNNNKKRPFNSDKSNNDFNKKNPGKENWRNRKNGKSNFNRDRNKNGNDRNNTNDNKNKNGNGNGKGGPKPDTPCPIHNGSHPWKKCFDNRYGDNYKPRIDNGSQEGNHDTKQQRRSGGYSGPTHQSHLSERQLTTTFPPGLPPASLMCHPTLPPAPPPAMNHSFYQNAGPPGYYGFQTNPGDPANTGSQPGTSKIQFSNHHLDKIAPNIQCFCLVSQQPDATTDSSANTFCYNCSHSGPSPPSPSDIPTSFHIQAPPSSPDSIPALLTIVGSIQQVPSFRALLVSLADSGGSHTLINSRCLPPGATPRLLTSNVKFSTAAGELNAQRVVMLRDICLTEFSRSTSVDQVEAFVFDGKDVPYDIILGRPFLRQYGITLDFQKEIILHNKQELPMKDSSFFRSRDHRHDTSYSDEDEDPNDESFLLESKYEKVNVDDVAQQQKHLTTSQQNDLANIFRDRTKLFSGKLGVYKRRKIHLDIKPEAVPKHMKAYTVPSQHREIASNELLRLVEVGAMKRCGVSSWGSPTFFQPKKDGRIRVLTDFRYLNTQLHRRVYPLPRIQDILTKRKGYRYFTKIDISMQYYTFELDDESSWLCVTVTPFGKFRYTRLPMGVHMSPDIAQDIMEEIFQDMDEIDVYIDDIGIWSDDWESHKKSVAKALGRLEDEGFTVNPLKCEWAVQETDWLGYWLTPTGLKPWKKKIEAILSMKPPRNKTELRTFLGAITFYRDMWARRSHILAPLTAMTGSGPIATPFTWGPSQQQAFDTIRSAIAKDVLLRYPDHNLPFEIETDASDYQLGSVIKQQGMPVAFFSRKLSPAELNYTTMEKELLSIKETLRTFRNMLLGTVIDVYTDHKNLTYTNITSPRVLRWRLLFEEFNCKLHYKKGSENIVADALSRLPRGPPTAEKSPRTNNSPSSSLTDDDEMHDFFLLHPTLPNLQHAPADYSYIRQRQQNDPILLAMQTQFPHLYPTHRFGAHELVCYQETPESRPVIYIAEADAMPLIQWYHTALNHAGSSRLLDTLKQGFYSPRLKHHLEAHVHGCTICQRNKRGGRGYGELPPRIAHHAPWNEVAVDLIGPWTIRLQDGRDIEFKALTAIDTVTNLTEILRIENKTSNHVAHTFENGWLARYPRPNRCIHDNGGEFLGWEFQDLLHRLGIKDVPTTVKNPQANAICERMHQSVGNALRTYLHGHPPTDEQQATEIIDSALASAMYAVRATVHGSLRNSPGALAFQRDMLLDIPLIADLHAIQHRRQLKINSALQINNKRRIPFDYHVNQSVLIRDPDPRKLDPPYYGPFPITQVFTNGTVTVQVRPGVQERINLRRLKPFRN